MRTFNLNIALLTQVKRQAIHLRDLLKKPRDGTIYMGRDMGDAFAKVCLEFIECSGC